MMLTLKKLVVAIAALLPAVAPANAANLLNTTFPNSQTFSTTGFLAVFPSGSFTQSFFSQNAETAMISFSAVCSVTGTTNQFVAIKILVDGKGVYPTSTSDDVFCSAVGTTAHATGWARSTVVTALDVAAGNHNIQVQATPKNGGVARFDNLVMLVWD